MQTIESFIPSFDLQGKTALITGSAQGLGWAIAAAYAGLGAHVILNGRTAAPLLQAQQRLQAAGYSASVWCQDISDLATLEAAYAALPVKPDILVNTVGSRLRSPLSELNVTQITQHIQDNLTATVVLSKLAAMSMAAKGYGRIITLSSIAGRIARAGDAVYPVAKQGLEAMVRSLAVEFGAQGVTSNGIAPGTFATESNQVLANDPVKGAHVIGRNPLARWAQSAEITPAAVFLASTSASYVNGHIIVVDGGFSITF
ncbi:SDR family oxidoreductase [Paenalcaligenes suwonensis]|uniref:SDR family oxidoreductase n=1 Tax=Paenalcaligenes suwonensis TaxID=1202713 RepID=UPI00140D6DE8|nr:SDR family oxidoreductase [Paenalcaligenes suwonensis]NHC62239.1 SDR family oxidoreductase [Paenalcaligenes suwonensis]